MPTIDDLDPERLARIHAIMQHRISGEPRITDAWTTWAATRSGITTRKYADRLKREGFIVFSDGSDRFGVRTSDLLRERTREIVMPTAASRAAAMHVTLVVGLRADEGDACLAPDRLAGLRHDLRRQDLRLNEAMNEGPPHAPSDWRVVQIERLLGAVRALDHEVAQIISPTPPPEPGGHAPRGPGRPPISPREPETVTLATRVPPSLRAWAEARAAEAGVSVGAVVREALERLRDA